MTDKTKTELAAIIGGMTTSQIKKASHSELMNRAAHALGKRTEMDAFGDDPDALPVTDNSSILTPTDDDVLNALKSLTVPEQHLLSAFAHCENTVTNGAPKQATAPHDLTTWVWLDDRKVGDFSVKQKKGVLSSLVKKGLLTVVPHSDGDIIGWSFLGFEVVQSLIGDALPPMSTKKAVKAKAPKAIPTARRKLNADGILFAPADTQKAPKEGSKRALLLSLLRGPEGTTVDDMAAATAWSRAVAGSALYVDVKGSGYGVERIDGRLHLLPRGAK